MLPWRRGADDIEFASGTEDPGSNPDRLKGFSGRHSNAVVYNTNCLCVEKKK
jgi:hypothetical protein